MATQGRLRRFPDGFLFGTKSSAYQMEGSVDADGRGRSIWDTFSHTPGRTRNGDNGDITADSYRHIDQDLDLLGDLGAPAYCFSIAWPRVQPDGAGPANQRGLDFYRRLVESLRGRGIVPVPTLFHWDLPQALQDRGGWMARDTAHRFAEYASMVAAALGDGVEMWFTHNEPWCASWVAHARGEHAPGWRDLGAAAAATHHLLLSHGEAVSAIRSAAPRARVGIDLNLQPIRPASQDEADLAAARRVDGNLNRLFLDPVLRGEYPADMLEHYAARKPGFSVMAEGDLEVISQPLDFLGVNYYGPETVCAPERMDAARGAGYWVPREPPRDEMYGDLRMVRLFRPGVERTPMDWEVDPAGLTEVLLRVSADYAPPPMYVMENGRAADDYVDPGGRIQDVSRIDYLRSHMGAVLDALERGADVRGYFVWSLLDNYEWSHGFSKRFGLVWVDYPTGARVPKASFGWYRDTVRARALADAS
ncbi:MAG TPA: family 1 glycosylhydrolase [Candidatus Binatia bacterium]|nr:family 1 glycosylhydrolase [Candidatus Binatia bacterium]